MKKNLMFLTLVVILTSCNINYDEGTIVEELDVSVPDVVMDDVTVHFVRGTILSIAARKVEIYSENKTQNMFDVEFSEVERSDLENIENEEGKMRMYGSAQLATIETDTNNVTITGELFARSNTDETQIKTNYLQWFDGEKRIEGSKVEPVTIKRDDGSLIEGYGLVMDAKERSLSLDGGMKGELVVEE